MKGPAGCSRVPSHHAFVLLTLPTSSSSRQISSVQQATMIFLMHPDIHSACFQNNRILMIFRPPDYYYYLSRLYAIIIFTLVVASSSSSPSPRLPAFSFRIFHPRSSAAEAAIGLLRRTSASGTIQNRSSSSATPTTTERLRLAIASRAVAVSSSNGENTDSMTSPPPTIATDAPIPGLASQTLHNLVEYATSFSAANGLQVELRDSSSSSPTSTTRGYITAPISLLPQCYPASQFRRATLLAAPFNILVDRISIDGEFLKKTLRDVRDVDIFTGKLLELYEEIYLGKTELE